ncbi:MAG: hypothetical protein WCP85_05640 [Mariniphaga sp.]
MGSALCHFKKKGTRAWSMEHGAWSMEHGAKGGTREGKLKNRET